MTGIVFKKDEDNKVKLDDMLTFLSAAVSKHRGTTVTITAQPGRKFIKLVEEAYGQRSVYCFVDYDGNIYKAASWAAPAKHVRGSVFDEEFGWGRALTPYGAAYRR